MVRARRRSPAGLDNAQGGGGGGFASEASLPLRIRGALAAGVEALERAEVSHASSRRSGGLSRVYTSWLPVRDAMRLARP